MIDLEFSSLDNLSDCFDQEVSFDNSVEPLNRSQSRIELKTNLFRNDFSEKNHVLYMHLVKVISSPFESKDPSFLFKDYTVTETLIKHIGVFIPCDSYLISLEKVPQKTTFLICSDGNGTTFNTCTLNCPNHVEIEVKFKREVNFNSFTGVNSDALALCNTMIKQTLRSKNYLFQARAKVFYDRTFGALENKGFRLTHNIVDKHSLALRIDTKNNFIRPITFESIYLNTLEQCNNDETRAREQFLIKVKGQLCHSEFYPDTFRVSSVEFDCNPNNKMVVLKNKQVSLTRFYKLKYDYTVGQCLFILKVTNRDSLENTYFLPKISSPVGLMKDETEKIQKVKVEEAFTMQKQNILRAKESLGNLYEIEVEPITVEAKLQNYPTMVVSKGKNQFVPSKKGKISYSNFYFNDKIKIENFLILYFEEDKREVFDFWEKLKTRGKDIGIFCEDNGDLLNLRQGLQISLEQLKAKIKQICEKEYKILFFFFKNELVYSPFKQAINESKCPCVSQCVKLGTEMTRDMFNNLLIQIASKLGYIPWKVKNLLSDVSGNTLNALICSYSVGEITKESGNIGFTSFVALINYRNISKKVYFDAKHEDWNGYSSKVPIIVGSVLSSLKKAKIKLPSKIIVYRSGPVHNLMDRIEKEEFIPTVSLCKQNFGKELDFTFIFVEPKSKIRFFNVGDKIKNPEIGTVIEDAVITKGKSFYLVNNSNETPVEPALFTVVDGASLDMKVIQKLTFWLCFLYFNSNKINRVPGIVTNIKKRMDFIRQVLKEIPNKKYRKYDISA